MGHPPTERHRRRAAGLVCSALTLVSTACGGPIGPTPSTRKVVSLDIVCPASLLVGQSSFCFAQAHYSDGSTRNPAPAVWSSSDPNVASIAALANAGSLVGRGAGQTVITSQFEEGSATAVVSVRAENFIAITGELVQGLFQTGRTITLITVGEYGVASADSGQLNIEITDQDGKILMANTPTTVDRGGGKFSFTTTFTISSGTTKVCRTAVLQIGALRLIDGGSAGLLSCVSVVP